MITLFLFLTATTTADIPFSLIIGIVGGFGTIATALSYFFSLKERVSKLELRVEEQDKQITSLLATNNTTVEKLTNIEKSLGKIETALQFYREAQQAK